MYNLVGVLLTFGALVFLILFQHWLLTVLDRKLIAHVDFESWLADQAGFANSERTIVWVATDQSGHRFSRAYTEPPKKRYNPDGTYYFLGCEWLPFDKKLVPAGECAKFYLIQAKEGN